MVFARFLGGVNALYEGISLWNAISNIVFPFLGWFIPAYLGLFLISPILNQYAEHEDSKRFGLYLLLFFSLQFFFDLICQRWSIFERSIFNHGYSILSFVPLYLLGRFLKLYRPAWLKKSFSFWISVYCGIFLFSTCCVYVLLRMATSIVSLARYANYAVHYADCYTSPICILGSLFLFLAFESLSLKNRFINHIAASVLGVFCFHSMSFYAPIVCGIYSRHCGISVLLRDGVFIIGVYCVGCIIDQLRFFIWKLWSVHVLK